MVIKRVAVYCGAAAGNNPAYADSARAVAAAMCERGLDLVYGGGRLGLMGIVADAVLAGGGKVHGVIPRALEDLEVAHRGVSELITVDTMHERKAHMTELADAFLVLPGGIGTLDELFEAWSWNALGYHAQPFCLLNVDGFWNGMVSFLHHAAAEGFMSPQRHEQLLVASEAGEALDMLDRAAQNATKGMVW